MNLTLTRLIHLRYIWFSSTVESDFLDLYVLFQVFGYLDMDDCLAISICYVSTIPHKQKSKLHRILSETFKLVFIFIIIGGQH